MKNIYEVYTSLSTYRQAVVCSIDTKSEGGDEDVKHVIRTYQ